MEIDLSGMRDAIEIRSIRKELNKIYTLKWHRRFIWLPRRVGEYRYAFMQTVWSRRVPYVVIVNVPSSKAVIEEERSRWEYSMEQPD